MKLSYKQQLFTYFFIIFALFTVSIIIVEQHEEVKQRTEGMESRLDSYAEMIHSYINTHQLNDSSMYRIDDIARSMPMDIRATIINNDGNVIFDKDISNPSKLENHLSRPEIMSALYQEKGSDIRISTSTQQEYLYYAKHYKDYYVRVALPYNIETQSLLKADNMFVYIALILFVVVLLLLNYVADRFTTSISQLKDLAIKIKEGKPLPENIIFPHDELGDIGNQLVTLLKQKDKSQAQLEMEKEKLIQHFHFAHEGICIFDHNFKKIYANTNFFQYFNFVTDEPAFDLEAIVKEQIFSPVIEFLNNRSEDEIYHTYQINKSGKTFSIQTVVFEDDNFEITIKDISKAEKNRLLKQEMTSNIAHELRTPVTSLRAYLETLTSQELPIEKKDQFIDRAYQQSVRLSNLIEDITLISKIEETSNQFQLEKIHIAQLIEELRINLTDKLMQNDIRFNYKVSDGLIVKGNYTLVYSIFRNLIENTISYAGKHIEININNYMEDDSYVYFSYYDTGCGVDEQHLSRLFERFYRVNEGRTRETGGSGLGLSIVKNAVIFHKGKIQVKNRKGGGLEFFFTLKK